MAIRIRRVDNHIVAICAAHSKAKAGDIYINDGEHHALFAKFSIDYETMKFIPEAHVHPGERKRIKQEETERCGDGCPECPDVWKLAREKHRLKPGELYADQYLCNHPAMEGARS